MGKVPEQKSWVLSSSSDTAVHQLCVHQGLRDTIALDTWDTASQLQRTNVQGRDLASLTAAHLPTRSLCPRGVTAAPGCHTPQQQPPQQSWQRSRAQGFTAGFTENTQGCSRNSRMTRDDDQSTASSALKDSSRKSAELPDEGDVAI